MSVQYNVFTLIYADTYLLSFLLSLSPPSHDPTLVAFLCRLLYTTSMSEYELFMDLLHNDDSY
jgi:hypothetical protein